MKDRRVARRYDLSLPVSFHTALDKDSTSRTGKTRDISNRGIYFTIDNDLNAGSEIDLTMTLPSEITHGGSEVLIHATGKVIRVDKPSANGDQKVGVVAVFERYEIVRSESDIV